MLKHYWVIDTELNLCLSNISVFRFGKLLYSVLQNGEMSDNNPVFRNPANIYDFSEFRWENRPITVLRRVGTPHNLVTPEKGKGSGSTINKTFNGNWFSLSLFIALHDGGLVNCAKSMIVLAAIENVNLHIWQICLLGQVTVCTYDCMYIWLYDAICTYLVSHPIYRSFCFSLSSRGNNACNQQQAQRWNKFKKAVQTGVRIMDRELHIHRQW